MASAALPARRTPRAALHALMLAYCDDAGLDATRAALLEEIDERALPMYHGDAKDLPPPLLALVEEWLDGDLAQRAARIKLERGALAGDELQDGASIDRAPTNSALRLAADPSLVATMPMLHAANVLATRTVSLPGQRRGAPLLLSTAADRSLVLSELPSMSEPEAQNELARVVLAAPGISLALHPSDACTVAVGLMDGSVAVVRVTAEGDVAAMQVAHVAERAHERKPVSVVRWMPAAWDAGEPPLFRLATGGYDKRLVLHAFDAATLSLAPVPGLSYTFAGAVESAAPVPDAHALVVAVRDSADVYICATSSATPAVRAVSTHGPAGSAAAQSGHVSFSAVHVATSPSKRHLLMATTTMSGRVIVWRWVSSAGLVVGNVAGSEHATSAHIVARLEGHAHVVRDLVYEPVGGRLVTGAFDQTVKVWKVVGE